jgi:PAS domain S-box-containing protein
MKKSLLFTSGFVIAIVLLFFVINLLIEKFTAIPVWIPYAIVSSLLIGVFTLIQTQNFEKKANLFEIKCQKKYKDIEYSEKKYKLLVQNAPVGFAVTTPAGQFKDVNLRFLKLFACKNKDQVMNTPVINLYRRPKDREKLRVALNTSHHPEAFEFEFKRFDGTSFLGVLTSVKYINEREEEEYLTIIQDSKTLERHKDKSNNNLI